MRTLRLPLAGSGKILSEKSPPDTHSSSAGSRGRTVSSTIPLKMAAARFFSTISPSTGLSFTHSARREMLASAGSGKTYRPSSTCEVSFWKTSSTSVRATPSRSTTSTLCETSRTPETTSVLPGTRAVMRPSPRGPPSVAIAGCVLITVRCGSTATNDAVRSGGRPLARSAVSPDRSTIAWPPPDFSVSFPFSTVTEARSSPRARTSSVPPTLGSISAVRPASSIRSGSASLALPSFRTTIEPCETSRFELDPMYDGALVAEVQVGAGTESESGPCAARAFDERAGAESLSSLARGEHFLPSRSQRETADESAPEGSSTSTATMAPFSLALPPNPGGTSRSRAENKRSAPR